MFVCVLYCLIKILFNALFNLWCFSIWNLHSFVFVLICCCCFFLLSLSLYIPLCRILLTYRFFCCLSFLCLCVSFFILCTGFADLQLFFFPPYVCVSFFILFARFADILFLGGGGEGIPPPPPAPPPPPLMSVCLSLYSLCGICLPAVFFPVFLSFLCLHVSFFILSAGFDGVQLFLFCLFCLFVCLLSTLYLCLILHSLCRIY